MLTLVKTVADQINSKVQLYCRELYSKENKSSCWPNEQLFVHWSWSQFDSYDFKLSTLVTSWTVAHQAPLSMKFCRQRILAWVTIPFSKGSSQPGDWTQVSCIGGTRFNLWATREALSLYRGRWQMPLLFSHWQWSQQVPICQYLLTVFTERTAAEAEAPILWLPHRKDWLIGKDPDVRKDWGRRRRGWQRMRWLDGITNSMYMSSSKLQDGEGQGSLACCSPCGRKVPNMTE